ncbi:molecular chaperone DnaJ [Synechococcus sp. UW179B]|jgi:hypothetical protein|uniref:molecular chaperone DnaJ n=1 Tax=Synechococcus sp. UW179B TaxID=2575516 RepID=UPI000E0FF1B9|nr:molecular chaperone DnaJ [Synechococcus sp. UW179B]
MSSAQEAPGGSGFGTGNAGGSKRNRNSKRKPGHSNHGRERQPLGRDPDFEAICARQTLGLALSGRLTEQAVKRVHKALAVQHHPDKGGDPDVMTRLNNARDVLLQPEMSDTLAS